MTEKIFNLSAHISSPEESCGVSVLAFQETFRKKGRRFFTWEKEIVVKLGRAILIKMVEEEVKRTQGDVDMLNNVIFLTPDIIEYTLGWLPNDLLEPCDEMRVYVNLNINRNEDDDPVYRARQSPEESVINNNISVAKIEVMGDQERCGKFISALLARIDAEQRAEKISLVKWIYSAGSYNKEKIFQIKKEWEIHESFYPWIKDHLAEQNIKNVSLRTYYEAYLRSKAQILVLFGDPGTGKTSFLRDMICEMNLNALISYDLKVLTSDATFVDYLTSEIFDMIIIEDADELLTSTRGEHNKVISKILNVSDGLIKLPKKKLVFTTNLKDVNEIDSAVYRLGRCFDVLNFRHLTREEAVAAGNDVGVILPEKNKRNQDNFTLADIFFLKSIGDAEDPFIKKNEGRLKRTFGFIGST